MAKPSGRRPRRGKSLGRRTSGRSPRRTVVVFCEGALTEIDYLKALKAGLAVNQVVSLDIDGKPHGAVPLTLARSPKKTGWL